MRRVMVDDGHGEFVFESAPDADQRNLKIVSAAAGNVGRTGLKGVAKHVASKQDLTLTVEESGAFDHVADAGAKFSLTMDQVLDPDDPSSEIVDSATLAMGESGVYVNQYVRVLNSNSSDEIKSPCIIETNFSEEDASGAASVASLLFIKGNDVRQSKMPSNSFEWPSLTIVSISEIDTNPDVVDGIELDDGTIVVVTGSGDRFDVYRSFDGADFDKVVRLYQDSTLVGGSGNIVDIAIDRIGKRLVVVYMDDNDDKIYAIYSDDNGITWSSASEVFDHGSTGASDVRLDLFIGQNDKLYLTFVYGFTPSVKTSSTLDGVDWTTPSDMTGTTDSMDCASIQEPSGRWTAYRAYDDGAGSVGLIDAFHTYESNMDGATWTNPSGGLLSKTIENGGSEVNWIAMRALNNGAFIDVVACYEDAASSKYALVVWRLVAWSSYLPETASTWYEWASFAYPSTADADPDLDIYNRSLTGSSTSTLSGNQLTLVGNGGNAYYSLASITGEDFAARFCVRCDEGYTKVRITTTSGVNFVDIEIQFNQSTGLISLYDYNGTTNRDTILPSNWSIEDFNEYVVIVDYSGASARVYRAPVGDYQEAFPFELILQANGTLTQSVGTTERFQWGYWNTSPTAVNNESKWLWVHYSFSIYPYTDAQIYGMRTPRRCPTIEPVGLLQGVSAKFAGEYAVEDDEWSVETGAVYEPENIFVDSPSIGWREPSVAAGVASTNKVFTWKRTDSGNDVDVRFMADAFAVFGRNWLDCKLESSEDGSSWSTRFDSSGGSDKSWIRRFTVGEVNDNIVNVDRISSDELWMVHNQFASNAHRKWYAYFVDGAMAGYAFKVLANTNNDLIFGIDLETLGVAEDDEIKLYGDRFYFNFGLVTEHERNYYRLTVYGQHTDPTELQLMLGTVRLGREYSLSDDEWTSTIQYMPKQAVVEGRSGTRLIKQLGPTRRTISLEYTGQVDRGMGVEAVEKLVEFTDWGIKPIVWLDDDSVLNADSNACHHEPILARASSSFAQQRAAYFAETAEVNGTSVQMIRNILDMGFELIEVV